MVNRYGLSRRISDDVKFRVRQKCGFGCVVCGSGIYHYDHVTPEFKDAKSHDAAQIALLCGSCHDKKTRGFLSTATVLAAMVNPKALQKGFAKDVLDVGNGYPTLMMGAWRFTNVYYPIWIDDRPLIAILPPEMTGSPFRFSAIFTDSSGTKTLEIYNNEWYAEVGNWDVETKGGMLIIRETNGEEHLILNTTSGDTLTVQYLRMRYKGYLITADPTKFSVLTPTGCQFTGKAGGGMSNTTFGLICEDGMPSFRI